MEFAKVYEKSKVPQIAAAFAKHSAEFEINISIPRPRSRENNPIRIVQPSAKGQFSMNPITSAKSKLGFVGVGYMGRPIARRLLEAGFKLAAYDRDRNKAQELIRYGGAVADSLAELSSSCNVVLSCLPSAEALLNIYTRPDGPFPHARPGHSVIAL